MLHVSDWMLVNFSKLHIFKFAQPVEFRGVTQQKNQWREDLRVLRKVSL
jgi:hypothetical protein